MPNTTKLTAKERIEIVAASLLEIDLDNYLASYAINNCANDLINASAVLLQELFDTDTTKESN